MAGAAIESWRSISDRLTRRRAEVRRWWHGKDFHMEIVVPRS